MLPPAPQCPTSTGNLDINELVWCMDLGYQMLKVMQQTYLLSPQKDWHHDGPRASQQDRAVFCRCHA